VHQYGIEQKKVVYSYNDQLNQGAIFRYQYAQNSICRNPHSNNVVFVGSSHNITFIEPENYSVTQKTLFKNREKIMQT